MIDQRWIVQIHSSGREPMSFDVVRIAAMAVALIALVLLSACGDKNVRPQPVDEGCDAICRTPCDTSVPVWTPPDPDAADAWDTYPEQVTIPLQGKVKQCDELHRGACVQCLDRLKAAGVTR